MELFTYLQKLGLSLDETILRESLRSVVETLMELDVASFTDAEYYERIYSRVNYRNGYRKRNWKTPVGTITLRIPKLRRGTYYPDFITPELATRLLSLIQQGYVQQAKLADIEAFLKQLQLFHVPPEPLVEHLEQIISRMRDVSIEPVYPYLWLDVVALQSNPYRIAAIAIGINEQGKHDVLGFQSGISSDDEDFWLSFIRKLVERGLSKVKLVISDAHRGIKAAIYEELIGAEWQYSWLHFLPTILDGVHDLDKTVITDAISTLFVQPDRLMATARLRQIIKAFEEQYPKTMLTLQACQSDIVSHFTYPLPHHILTVVDTLSRVKQNLEDNLPDAIGIPIEIPILFDELIAADRYFGEIMQPSAFI